MTPREALEGESLDDKLAAERPDRPTDALGEGDSIFPVVD